MGAPARTPNEGPALLLHLSTDPTEINAAINDPSVRPYIGAPELGELDVSPLLKPENLFPFGEHGGFALVWTAPKTREVHTYIRKTGRGRWAYQAVKEMVALARENGTERLFTKIPPASPHVGAFARFAGFQPTGEMSDSLGVLHEVFGLTCH